VHIESRMAPIPCRGEVRSPAFQASPEEEEEPPSLGDSTLVEVARNSPHPSSFAAPAPLAGPPGRARVALFPSPLPAVNRAPALVPASRRSAR
jgi:hypothetical protein